MPWGAAGAIGSASLGYAGAQSAAGRQESAERKAAELEQAQFQEAQRLEQPFVSAGTAAQNALTAWLGLRPDGSINPNAPGAKQFSLADFTADPGYQFRLQQGQEALTNQRSALGGQLSGATLKDLTNYSQGMASQEFNDAYNRFRTNQSDVYGRLAQQAGQGAQVAGNLASLGMGEGGASSSDIVGAGNASAAGLVGGINAINSGIGQGYNFWLQNQILNRTPSPFSSSPLPSATPASANNYSLPGYSLKLLSDAANDPSQNWYTPSYFGTGQ